MNVISKLVALMLTCALAGCGGKLAVTVRAASPAAVNAWAQEQVLRDECRLFVTQTNEDLERTLDPVVNETAEATALFAAALRLKAEEHPDPYRSVTMQMAADLPALPADTAENLGTTILVQQLAPLRDRLQSQPVLCDPTEPTMVDAMVKRRLHWQRFVAAAKKIVTDLASETSKRIGSAPETPSANAPAQEKVVAIKTEAIDHLQQCRDLICGGGLAESPYAAAVSSLPDAHWGPPFNYATGEGQNGNVDIVVKMTSRADFTVKGMRFDVSKIPEIARKGLIQALSLAASIKGVGPISAPTTAAENTGVVAAGPQFATSQQIQAKRDALLQARTDSMVTLGVLIAAGAKGLEESNRVAFGDAIKAQVDASSELLKLDTYPAN